MNSLSGSMSVLAWMYVTAMIFVLQLQLSSAGDKCPLEDVLEPCTCFQDSGISTPTPLVTTEATPSTPAVKESTSKEVKEGPLPKVAQEEPSRQFQETPTSSPLPPNATCCTVVSCTAPTSLLVLEDTIAKALNRKWVDKLVLSNLPPQPGYTLVHLPKAFLRTLRVKHFEVKDTLLYGDFIYYGLPFESQEHSMLWFTVNNCQLGGSLSYDTVGTVNTKGLNNMPKIEGVDFSRNYLVLITSNAFRYPPTNLTTIILSHNSIQSIESSTFHYAPYLKLVDFSHNFLEYISRSIFAAPATNLQHIDLSWNQLKELSNDLFVNMPMLKVVKLNNNFLTSLPSQPWGHIWRQLTYVDVASNYILCDCSVMWLLPILSPPVAKASTTPAPAPLGGQTILGGCWYGLANQNSRFYQLATLMRKHLNC